MLRATKTDRRKKKKKAVPYGGINLSAGRWAEDDGRWAGHLLSFCGVQCDFLCVGCVAKFEWDLQKTNAAVYAEYEQARQREKDSHTFTERFTSTIDNIIHPSTMLPAC